MTYGDTTNIRDDDRRRGRRVGRDHDHHHGHHDRWARRAAFARTMGEGNRGPLGPDGEALRAELRQVRAAGRQLAVHGTPDQQIRGRAVVEETRRALYRILAEGSPVPAPGDEHRLGG